MSAAVMALPASPTLTNPDMILPYGEYDTTPSPPHDPLRPESPVGGWKGLIPGDMTFSIGPPGHVKLGLGSVTPTTPIIYGNGTMLSDIGEVTEAESTPGRKPSRTQPRIARGQDSPVRSSPTMGYDQNPVSKRRSVIHHRSVSMESDSTVRSDGPPADLFKDFDDGVSVDDSNFQGDDEESLMGESIDDDAEIVEAELVTRKETRLIETDDMHSSAALSRRAEMILANAKKRLDNMEGNLTRARSSLYITPSSISSIHSSSPLSRTTPSPPGAERRIITGLGVPPAKHRQNNQLVSPESTQGHGRVFSENSIPSSLQSPLRVVRSPPAGLSSSILGGDDKSSKSSRYATPPTRSPNYYAVPLEPLDEDEITPPRTEEHEMVRASTADPYSTPTTDHRVLTRSTSSMQMRDLTDKMKDLKGKISTLRDKAREENMKRRSLQSLRTPSPFTAAEQWYTSSAAYNGDNEEANAGIARDPRTNEPRANGDVDGGDGILGHDLMREPPSLGEPEGPLDHEEVDEEEHVNGELEPVTIDYHVPASISEQDDVYETAEEEEEGEAASQYIEEEVEGDQYDDEFVHREELDEPGDYQSEGETSLYHDSLAQPISHEDREDAFDYEHFFLHSAMGTINRERLARRGSRGSLGSYGSDDSIETAKGPEAPVFLADEDNIPIETLRGHLRSQKSTSTMASFVTATEGGRFTDVQEDEDIHDYAVQPGSSMGREQGPDLLIEKGSIFDKTNPTKGAEIQQPPRLRPSSAILSTTSEPSASHRPSIASFASTSSVGTSRSFPLINKNANRASFILSEAMSMNGREGSPVDMLAREDQILIERLVSSLGKCVLGLYEAGRASSEGRMWRRRMDAAKQALEGEEGSF